MQEVSLLTLFVVYPVHVAFLQNKSIENYEVCSKELYSIAENLQGESKYNLSLTRFVGSCLLLGRLRVPP